MSHPKADEAYLLDSVARAAAVLTRLAEGTEPMSLKQVALGTGLSEATALRYLTSLVRADLAERDSETGAYRLGLGTYRLGMRALDQRDIQRLALPGMTALRDEFQETVNLAANTRAQVLVLHVLEASRSVRKGVPAGTADEWHSTSVGKAILSRLDEADARDILSRHDLTGFTPRTLTSTDALLRDLELCRKRGYAIDNEESMEGLRCVGAAITDHNGYPAYAISVSGPNSRMPSSQLRTIGEAVASVARQVSGTLGSTAPK